jgi:hypothetical protein
MRLEAEEIGGLRVLKYRFTVVDEPPVDKEDKVNDNTSGSDVESNKNTPEPGFDETAVLTTHTTPQIAP